MCSPRVATSSGALTAAYYAAAIHSGHESTAGVRLAQLWIDEASFMRSASLSLAAIVGRRGLSSARKLRRLLRANILSAPARRPVELRLVVTNLDGQVDIVAGTRATAHEHVFTFDGDDLASEARLERLFDVVTASAAFPGVFEPVTLRIGRRDVECIDGGATDNGPLGHALRGAPEISRVFVISTRPRADGAHRRPWRGLAYGNGLAQTLVDERLSRDLAHADYVNHALERLHAALPDPLLRTRVLRALGWSHRRPIDIVEIRPERALEGNAFSGWFSRRLREDYVAAGRHAALRALARQPSLQPNIAVA